MKNVNGQMTIYGDIQNVKKHYYVYINILQKERKHLMEKEMNIQEPLHRNCAPHDAGTTPDSARHNHNQDPKHGPGVK